MQPEKLANLRPIQIGTSWAYVLKVADKNTFLPPRGFAGWEIRAGVFADTITPQPLAVCSVSMDTDTRVLTLGLTGTVTAGLPAAASAMLLLFVKTETTSEPQLLGYGELAIAALGGQWGGLG
jgi:hypothetical protein